MDNHRKRWTQEDKDFLYDNWGTLTIKKISNRLGRSEKAVISFVEKNNIGGAYKAIDLSTTEVAEMLGVDFSTVINWIKNFDLKAKAQPLIKRKIYRININDLRKWCSKHQDMWRTCNLPLYGLGLEEQWLKDKRKNEINNVSKKYNSLWTCNEEATMLSLIKLGYTNREIGEKLGRTFNSVRRRRDKLIKENKLEPVSKECRKSLEAV